MNLIVEAPEADRTEGTSIASAACDRRRIDVTDLDARRVEEFVRSNVGTDRVCLEHRGGQTYLLVGE